MRDEWNENVERWSMRYALPIGTALGRYTDPVIVAGILRGVSASEVRAGETENELARALDSLDHQALNPILAAELLLAGHQRKLPLGAHADSFRARLAELPEAIRVGLEALLFST
jgi:hypothetical protein